MEPDSTIVGSMDMANGLDRGLLRRRITDVEQRREVWGGITDEMKAQYLTALRVALRISLERGDQRGIKGCVETMAKLVGQNLELQLFDEKNQRLDEGKLTENHGGVQFVIKQAERPESAADGKEKYARSSDDKLE